MFTTFFHNYAHKCNCNEAIEFRTKIVQSLKTSSIKLTSEVIEEIYIGNVPIIDVNCVNIRKSKIIIRWKDIIIKTWIQIMLLFMNIWCIINLLCVCYQIYAIMLIFRGIPLWFLWTYTLLLLKNVSHIRMYQTLNPHGLLRRPMSYLQIPVPFALLPFCIMKYACLAAHNPSLHFLLLSVQIYCHTYRL